MIVRPADHRGDGDQLLFFFLGKRAHIFAVADPYMRIGQSRSRGSELERFGFQFSYRLSISFERAEELRTLEM